MKLLAALLLLPSLFAGDDAIGRPKILGVAHIAVYVSNLDKSRSFWHDFLGYDEVFTLPKKDSADLSISFIKINDKQYIELFTETPRAGEQLNHISFYTDNAQAMRDYLASLRVKVPEKIGKGRTGNFNYNIIDPDGHTVEIVEYQPDSWTAREYGKHLPTTRISDRIQHVGVLVDSVDPAMEFYHGILGFNEFWRGSSTGKFLSWINMRVPDGQDYLEFMLYDQIAPPASRGGSNHLSLIVPDAVKAVDILKARAAKGFYTREIVIKTGINRKRQVNLFDPDGTRVELMEPNTVDGKPASSSTAPVIR